MFVTIPGSHADFEIPDEFKKLKATGEVFLKFDSAVDENDVVARDPSRFLIFVSKRGLENLTRCKQWATDATFR